MVRRNLRNFVAIALFVAGNAGAAPAPRFDKQPPGKIVQDVVAYLSGEAMNSRWHVVTSRKMVGLELGKAPAYQWYVSFYAPAGDGLKLVYQLPNKEGMLLDTVVKANGAELYFPRQNVQIVGTGEFERSGVQDVVIASRQSAADCGTADVTVFGARSDMTVESRVHVGNGCDLHAAIVKKGALQAIQLTGPYYGPKAALCCPTKPSATAVLAYSNGTWSVKPNYFIISASMALHHR